MKCWICGAEAATGEHMTKASDLRSLFGRVTQRAPLYMHSDASRNVPVPGINSAKLKFKSLICGHCNNTRTQAHDRAWAALSTYLRERRPPVRAGVPLRLSPVFPGCNRASMLDVHLYFVKLFGCQIVQDEIPIEIQGFSEAIMRGQAHPKVRLAFSACDEWPVKMAGITQVEAATLGGVVRFATWRYFLGRITVNVMYAEPDERRKGLVGSWHPATISKMVQIQKF